eukprot:216175_1
MFLNPNTIHVYARYSVSCDMLLVYPSTSRTIQDIQNHGFTLYIIVMHTRLILAVLLGMIEIIHGVKRFSSMLYLPVTDLCMSSIHHQHRSVLLSLLELNSCFMFGIDEC